MDCRGSLGLALCLLSSAAGCQHQVTTLSPTAGASVPMPHQDAQSVQNQIKKAASTPQKDPPAAVMVSWGDFKAGEAFSPDIPADRQQQIRDAARQDYERALKTDPKYVAAYQGIARLDVAMRNHTHAIETYQKALQIAPNSAVLWYEMGMSHNYMRNLGPALECLNRAAQLEPANRQYNNTLAVVLAQSGRYQESLTCFVRASGEAMGYMRLAQTLQHLQQPELSRQYMDVALQKDPNLATMVAMQNDPNDGSPHPPIQRTSYQSGSVPSSSSATSMGGYSGQMPRIIRLDAVETRVPPDTLPPAQSFIVPPPPTVNLHYPEPASE